MSAAQGPAPRAVWGLADETRGIVGDLPLLYTRQQCLDERKRR